MDVHGQVAIVTGSGQGLGRAYARALAERGATVVIAERNEERGRSVEKEITGAGGRAAFVAVDVASLDSVGSLADTVATEFGRADILVNNAAILSTIELKPFEEISLDEWETVVRVNLTGVFLACQAIVPLMRRNRYGRIVNVSSSTVLSGKPNYLHYVTSKAGVAGLTRALAREVGEDDITVNTLSPGPIETEVRRETVSADQWQQGVQQQCIKRRGTPQDLVGVVLYLCSPEASFITGQLINVDGGKMLH